MADAAPGRVDGIQGGGHGRTAGLSMAAPAAERGEGGKGKEEEEERRRRGF
jgi:hypothetical protein